MSRRVLLQVPQGGTLPGSPVYAWAVVEMTADRIDEISVFLAEKTAYIIAADLLAEHRGDGDFSVSVIAADVSDSVQTIWPEIPVYAEGEEVVHLR